MAKYKTTKSTRKSDSMAQSAGSTANTLMNQRQSKAQRLEEVTGIKQPVRKVKSPGWW